MTNNSRCDGRILSSSQAKRGAIVSLLSRVARIITATLREIFDESAYQRFLERSNLQSTRSAFAIFQRENDQAKSRRPRCC
jgi:hypothetical protein